MGYYGIFRVRGEVLGKLRLRWDVPGKIEKDLDEAITELKKLKKLIPVSLNNLSTKDEYNLKKVLAIIEGMQIPIRIKADA